MPFFGLFEAHFLGQSSVASKPMFLKAALLSGGCDSSIISALASRAVTNGSKEVKLHTFTIFFSESDSREHRRICSGRIGDREMAAQVAKHIGSVHTEVSFCTSEGLAALPHVVRHLETYDVIAVRAAVSLFLLAKHVSECSFKVVLCGEGANEAFAGYSLFERFDDGDLQCFRDEMARRLNAIDSGELLRVDRCTMAHGIEARVPILDVDFLDVAMSISPLEKLSHVSRGRVQKHIFRLAFHDLLPPSILYRRKEQFADGIGHGCIRALKDEAVTRLQTAVDNPELAEREWNQRLFTYANSGLSRQRFALVHLRQTRRRFHHRQSNAFHSISTGKDGSKSIRLWKSVSDDPQLSILVSRSDADQFIREVLDLDDFPPAGSVDNTLEMLNTLIHAMLRRVPSHNLTNLVRDRRPPTMSEIHKDMMEGLGGPFAVVNAFFAALLHSIGFGFELYLLSCSIAARPNCHVAILVSIAGISYFVDVANGKPYFEAVALRDRSAKCFAGLTWKLDFNPNTSLFELVHLSRDDGQTWNCALSFDAERKVFYSSFEPMITRSRQDPEFGPFLTGLRLCIYPSKLSIRAIRNRSLIIDNVKPTAVEPEELIEFTKTHFHHIKDMDKLVRSALQVLDNHNPLFSNITVE